MTSLKFNDVVQVASQYCPWPGWIGYVRGQQVPSILQGVTGDVLVRFAHTQTGLFRFLRRDLSGPEDPRKPYPMPTSQTDSRLPERVRYRSEGWILRGVEDGEQPEPEPEPTPEPIPEPEPTPEPQPEPQPDITIATSTVPSSMPLIFGDWGEAGLPIMLVGAGGIQQVLTGSKIEHGPGGFEFLVYGKGLHLLSIAGYQFNVWVIEDGRAIKVNFIRGQQEEMGRLTFWVSRSRAEMIMARYPDVFGIQ